MSEKFEKCLRCGRKLKTEQSREIGFGKVCWQKYLAEDNIKKLFPVGGCDEKSKN